MGDETPPPLPPKLRAMTGGRYSEQDIARALQEENEAYNRISREKLGRSQSHRTPSSTPRENGMGGQRSRTPTDFGNTQTTDNKPRPRPTTVPVNKIQPIAKPRKSASNASSSPTIQSQSRPNTLSQSQNTTDQVEYNKHEDLMSFNSPEKPKNDILEMLHSINENRSTIVHVTTASATSKHTFGISPNYNLNMNTMAPTGMPPLQMYPSSLGTIYPVLPVGQQQQQPWANGGFQGAFGTSSTVFSSAGSAFTAQQSMSTAVGLNFSNFTNSQQTVLYTAAAPPLPQRCPVTRSSLMAPQLSISGTSATSSPAVTPTTPTPTPTPIPSPGLTSFSLDLDPLGISSSKSIGESLNSSSVSASASSVFSSENKFSDLIDFGAAHNSSSATSVFDLFDPITLKAKEEEENKITFNETDETLSKEVREMLQIKSKSKKPKDDEMSYYEQVDPFEYMQPEASSTRSDPVYDVYEGLLSPGAVGGDTFDMPPPLPPRGSAAKDSLDSVEYRKSVRSPKNTRRDRKRSAIILDGQHSSGQIQLRKIPKLSADEEARAFWTCIKKLRGEYVWNDYIGNPGLLHSPCVEGPIDQDLSVKLKVFYMEQEPISFTCCLNTGIEHIIMQCSGDFPGDCTDYILKVHGVDEYLSGETVLGEYEYVHNCIKYDRDVAFTIIQSDSLAKSYQRTAEDDEAVEKIQVEQLMSAGSTDIVHFDSLSIVIETFERELTRLQDSGFKLVDGTPLQDLPSPMRSQRLRQIVKQMCSLLGSLETVEVTDAISTLVDTCRTIQKSQGVLDGEDDVGGDQRMSTGSHDNHNPEELKQWLLGSLSHLAAAVNNFLVMYTRAFRVDFTVDLTVDQTGDSRDIREVREKVSIKVQGLHRLDLDWKYDEYFIEAQLFHGSRALGSSIHTHPKKLLVDQKFHNKIIFNRWLDLACRVNTLPRESRMVITAYGVRVLPGDKAEEKQYIREEIGWAAIQMFSYVGSLSQGPHLLTLWPMISDRRLGPAPFTSDHPHVHSCPVLSVELAEFNGDIYFPDVEPGPPNKLDFSSLDQNTQQQLSDIIERDVFTFNKSVIEEREILWEKRHYLHDKPAALAKVLLAAHSWDITCLPDLHSLVRNWSAPQPADALHLLLPSFADGVVRGRAVEWIRGLGSDELVSFLPQLVQAVKHEAWDMSCTVALLLERALTSPRLAHHLYWLLNQCLPLQTNMGGERELVSDARYTRRLNLVTRTLMAICGKNMETRLLTQELMLRSLYATALKIKDTKDAQRMAVLSHDLEDMARNLETNPTSLPLSPSLEVAGVDIHGCAYYNSFTVPLKLAFYSSQKNTEPIHAIFKVGDDLRQDMLVIQMIRLMDKLWLKESLDLKMVTFSVVPTGDKIGIIELVKEAETLRKIQTEYGVTGSFKDRPIAEWLAKQNPSQLEYQRAVENFTKSCAGYCVATYILGVCDRHNDNIMLKTSGHLFHIDFGKFLGDAQKFGNFKRDRTPFVLTSDMAYVINGGEKLSDKFQSFVDLCCKAFNIIRRNGHLLLYLFALMASSGIPGVTWDAVAYVERSLLQDKTNAEAGAMFARMIQDSLKSWFTQVNFFIHNLAQMRFSGDQSDDTLLSFIPRTYTHTQDGKYKKIRLYNYQKRYNPNKYYVYIIKVERENQAEASYLFRSYKEFSEFHQKLCLTFPLARIHSLPKGVQIGRSEVKAVAEKRKFEIELFLKSLFDLTEEISHSDLVYTFFHPLLRDQEDTDIHIKKLKNKDIRGSVIQTSQTEAPVSLTPGHVQGQVRVSIQYLRGQLQIMVQHARNLCLLSGQQEPSPYVKLYLLPDPHKKTKRKTKVAKKTICPTFMEQITYRMSKDIVKQRVLEISVWSEDMLSENVYMGSAYLKLSSIELKEEQCEWLSLEHQINTAREHIITHPT